MDGNNNQSFSIKQCNGKEFLFNLLKERNFRHLNWSEIKELINIKQYNEEFLFRLLRKNADISLCRLDESGEIVNLRLQLSQSKDDIFNSIQLPKLKELIIYNGFFIEPKFLKEYIELKYLYLSKCNLTKIPNLSNIKDLCHLSFSQNCIEEINWFGDLEHLEYFNLTDDKLTSINSLENIKGCKNIKFMEFRGNQIDDLCNFEPLSYFPYLKEINLSDNIISELNVYFNVPSLERISLYNNQIKRISALKNLPALKTIGLNNNRITHLGNFYNLPSLKTLHVKDNPIYKFSHIENLPNLNSIEGIKWLNINVKHRNVALKYIRDIGLEVNFDEYEGDLGEFGDGTAAICGCFPAKRFRVNDYFELRLDKYGKTTIFINGIRFRNCASLFWTIPREHTHQIDNIESIDEAVQFLDNTLDNAPTEIQIDHDEKFWGHCSNLQAWYEHNYDTRLLHHSLAFCLLHELTKAGDPLAKRVFKEEIAKRYSSKHSTVVEFLEKEGYLRYLNKDQLSSIN